MYLQNHGCKVLHTFTYNSKSTICVQKRWLQRLTWSSNRLIGYVPSETIVANGDIRVYTTQKSKRTICGQKQLLRRLTWSSNRLIGLYLQKPWLWRLTYLYGELKKDYICAKTIVAKVNVLARKTQNWQFVFENDGCKGWHNTSNRLIEGVHSKIKVVKVDIHVYTTQKGLYVCKNDSCKG